MLRGMNAPSTLRAGDSVSWTESLPSYPSTDGWSLKFRLVWQVGSPVDLSASVAGGVAGEYSVNITSATSQSWVAGSATLVSWVEKSGGNRVTLEQQSVTILPDLTTSTTFDGRTANAKALADAKAALAAYSANGQVHVQEYDVGGRRMKFRSTKDITDLIAYYEVQVGRERALQAILDGGAPGRVNVRF